jgi:hypothetical protein
LCCQPTLVLSVVNLAYRLIDWRFGDSAANPPGSSCDHRLSSKVGWPAHPECRLSQWLSSVSLESSEMSRWKVACLTPERSNTSSDGHHETQKCLGEWCVTLSHETLTIGKTVMQGALRSAASDGAAWLSLAAAVRLGSNEPAYEAWAGCNIGWSLRTLHACVQYRELACPCQVGCCMSIALSLLHSEQLMPQEGGSRIGRKVITIQDV